MRRNLPFFLLLCGFAAFGAPAKPAPVSPPSDLPKDVQAAVRRGAQWLREDLATCLEKKKPDANPCNPVSRDWVETGGAPYLRALALLHAGFPSSDPSILALWERCKTEPRKWTYDLSLRLMFCEALVGKHAAGGPPVKEVRTWMGGAAEALARACAGGSWTYGAASAAKNGVPLGKAPEKNWAIDGPDLKELAAPSGDFSNTQYAVLGLKAASLCGVRPKGADLLWRAVAQQFMDSQEPEGPEVKVKAVAEKDADPDWMGKPGYKVTFSARARGWAYRREGGLSKQAYGTMTSGGICSLLVARSEVSDLSDADRDRIDRSIRDGMAWFCSNFSVEKCPQGNRSVEWAGILYYHLYGVERVGRLSGLEKTGDHDWYKEGAAYLLKSQKSEGSWPGGGAAFGSDSIRTSFALLFLCRATSPKYASAYKAEIGGEEKRD